ncbi:hypothetical protein IV203_020839 [Nitzschia inconspicua]|uniref:Indole-3-glycerol-phosphate synthase n=1 Tax=Nitzschia inconspicua TaxID=303405 RepID=A0A9K3KGG3_9STRA|nr:hypothetical protein IV203_020839 [Nitzschia inconspicua]
MMSFFPTIFCLLCMFLKADGFLSPPKPRMSTTFCTSFFTSSRKSTTTSLSSTADAVSGTAPILKSQLKKPSKVLTVGVEYTGNQNDKNELSILSMQLRKSKVSGLWCRQVELVQVFVEEQATARGNFPGPLPVIYNGALDQAVAAKEAGATAIVSSYNEKELLNNIETEIIWEISSVDEAEKVLKEMDDSTDAAFLINVDSDDTTIAQGILEKIPKQCLVIAALKPMQDDGAEVELGRRLKTLGCSSIFIRDACVGDGEDIEYTQFVVNGMTSKASSEFKFSGLTGSTNGHFGGVQANSKISWRRVASKSTS